MSAPLTFVRRDGPPPRRLAAGWVPVLVCLGLFAAFLTVLSPRLTPQRVPPRTDCRGPPAC